MEIDTSEKTQVVHEKQKLFLSSPFSLFIGLTIHFTSPCNVVLTTRLSHMITESNLSRS